MNDRQRLEAIINVIGQYLPPDGIPVNDAMSEIISLVDPLPPQRTWVGLTEQDRIEIYDKLGLMDVAWLDLMEAIETKLKEKNT